jgi:hypothetical protein
MFIQSVHYNIFTIHAYRVILRYHLFAAFEQKGQR